MNPWQRYTMRVNAPRPTFADAIYEILATTHIFNQRMGRFTFIVGRLFIWAAILPLILIEYALFVCDGAMGEILAIIDFFAFVVIAAIDWRQVICRMNDIGKPWVIAVMPNFVSVIILLSMYWTDTPIDAQPIYYVGLMLYGLTAVAMSTLCSILPTTTNALNQSMFYLCVTNPAPPLYFKLLHYDHYFDAIRTSCGYASMR